jgi:hypothetical protein
MCLVLLLVFAWRPAPPFPPSWKSEYGAERALPQLNGVEGYGEGREGRYVRWVKSSRGRVGLGIGPIWTTWTDLRTGTRS